MDFKYIQITPNSIFTKWEQFMVNIIPTMRAKIKDITLKTMLLDMNELEPGIYFNLINLFNISIIIIIIFIFKDQKNITLLFILHALVPPTAKFSRVVAGKKTPGKYTIKDSQNSFFLHGQTVAACVEKIKNMTTEGAPIQPFILLVGDAINKPRHILVFVDGVKYMFNTVLEAVDICFKVFFIFELAYPTASQHIWQLIQQFFYEIETPFDIVLPNIAQLMQDLKTKK